MFGALVMAAGPCMLIELKYTVAMFISLWRNMPEIDLKRLYSSKSTFFLKMYLIKSKK